MSMGNPLGRLKPKGQRPQNVGFGKILKPLTKIPIGKLMGASKIPFNPRNPMKG